MARFLTRHPTRRPGLNWAIWTLALVVAIGVVAGAAGTPSKTAADSAARSTGTSTAATPANTAPSPTGATTAPTARSAPAHRSSPAASSPRAAATGGELVTARGVVLPNPVRTPGAINSQVTQATIDTTICVSGWTATIRPPSSYTTTLKQQQLAAGYAHHGDRNSADYEEDHLISLELGGSPRSPRNLWPEPYAGSFGARLKDQIENKLHELVCAGMLPLAAARHAIATNWYTAYTTYLGTPAPASSTHPAPTTVTAPPASNTGLTCRASMSNPNPSDYSTTDVIVHTGVAGAAVTATAHYKSTDTSHSSSAGSDGVADLPFEISRATPGYTVQVDISVHARGASRACTISFTPQ